MRRRPNTIRINKTRGVLLRGARIFSRQVAGDGTRRPTAFGVARAAFFEWSSDSPATHMSHAFDVVFDDGSDIHCDTNARLAREQPIEISDIPSTTIGSATSFRRLCSRKLARPVPDGYAGRMRVEIQSSSPVSEARRMLGTAVAREAFGKLTSEIERACFRVRTVARTGRACELVVRMRSGAELVAHGEADNVADAFEIAAHAMRRHLFEHLRLPLPTRAAAAPAPAVAERRAL